MSPSYMGVPGIAARTPASETLAASAKESSAAGEDIRVHLASLWSTSPRASIEQFVANACLMDPQLRRYPQQTVLNVCRRMGLGFWDTAPARPAVMKARMASALDPVVQNAYAEQMNARARAQFALIRAGVAPVDPVDPVAKAAEDEDASEPEASALIYKGVLDQSTDAVEVAHAAMELNRLAIAKLRQIQAAAAYRRRA